ncbi:hypothetical protein [Streptosporangium sp. NPDC003464]
MTGKTGRRRPSAGRAPRITGGPGAQAEPFLLAGGEVLPATGRRVSLRCCCVFALSDNLVVSQRVYFDQLELYAQLGLRLTSGPR